MDIMEKTTTIFDEEPKEAETKLANEKTRKPYVDWFVHGQEYKLKLTTGVIRKLEQGFGKSLLSAVLDEGIPPINVVSTLLQAALQKFHHGMKSYTVDELLDTYIEEGGTQITLLQDVIYPLMHDAGFFTQAQMDLLTKEISEVDSAL